MGDDLVETRIAADRLCDRICAAEVAESHLADPTHRRAALSLSRLVEEIMPALERPAAALGGVAFPLNREKRIEGAERRGRGSPAGPARIARPIPRRETLAGNAPVGEPWRHSGDCGNRGVDTHRTRFALVAAYCSAIVVKDR